ncbi:hypothetical protein BZL41_17980 [Pseudomonas sp. PIC25]|uniref:protealysin inhibitor emfourin n=1 Tax=Pseudomonas sp. PIC25 TaxID=1958773 RepID=UPI000BABA0B3|nr:protealysin inhibitor emfourin [Pseudomonas sp. PIC25]PAU58407.1 hypothetical protein BZL41_17980 [Pseudomonas sp. PIC25]
MIELPPLAAATGLRVTREGGVAHVPGLVRACSIDLANCPEAERQQACAAVETAAPKASEPGQAGRGDQRYFRVEVSFQGLEVERISFNVPETEAPEALVSLWKQRGE